MTLPVILLFISTESPTHGFARRQIEIACDKAFAGVCPGELKVIDVGTDPKLAEEYNIEALPTVIIGEKRIIGVPALELLTEYLGDALRSQTREGK